MPDTKTSRIAGLPASRLTPPRPRRNPWTITGIVRMGRTLHNTPSVPEAGYMPRTREVRFFR